MHLEINTKICGLTIALLFMGQHGFIVFSASFRVWKPTDFWYCIFFDLWKIHKTFKSWKTTYATVVQHSIRQQS